MNRTTLGGFPGLSIFSHSGVSPRGIEVWVKEEQDAERAKRLIAEHEVLRQDQTRAKAALGPVEATCEDCRQTSTFPGVDRGTVQQCPRCGAYLDVPGDDELDWYDENAQREE